MVRLSLFVALTATLAITVNVQAIPINTDIVINARHQPSENHDILEPRMNNALNNAAVKLAKGLGKAIKFAGEVGKEAMKTVKEGAPQEAYSRTVNSLIHGGTTLAQSGPSNSPGHVLTPSTAGVSHTPPNRPSTHVPMEPINVPNWTQRPTVMQALKGVDIRSKMKIDPPFDPKKVGLAHEAPVGKPSPKVQVGGKPKAKEAPF